MATTKLKLYRRAQLILKQNAVGTTVTDGSQFTNTLDLVYDEALSYILEHGKWAFAARSLVIEASEDVEPQFGLSFAFEKPDDYKNLIALSAAATLYPPFGENEYRDEGAYWFTNVDPLYASIVSGGAEFGGDLSLWPQIVADAAAYELAWRVAPSLTGMSANEKEELRKDKERALRNAEAWNASKKPPEAPPPSRLVMSRRGRLSWRETWRAGS